MTAPVQDLTELTTAVPDPPPCDYPHEHGDAPPPADYIVYLREPCLCGPAFYVCAGHREWLTLYDLENISGYCDRCQWEPLYVARIDPL